MELNDYLVGFPSIGTADLDLLGLVEGQLDAHFFEKLQISSEYLLTWLLSKQLSAEQAIPVAAAPI